MHDDKTLDRLLSGRNAMAVTEKEAMLSRLLTAQRKPWLVRFRFPIAALSAAAVASVLLVLSPREFGVRGRAQANVRVSCGASDVCHRGDAIHFDVTPTRELRYFAAFGETASGEVVWFFPHSVAISQPGALPQAAVVDSAGVMTLNAVFSTTPLDQSEIRARLALGNPAPRPELVVITRRLEVLP